MKLVELHILQSFPVTCLNRDDVGAPKTAYFGGVPRARVSSQCWKRAIRMFAKQIDQENGGNRFAGVRSHYLADELAKRLVEHGLPSEKARDVAATLVEFLGNRDSKSRGTMKSSVALFLSPREMDAIAQAAAEQWREKEKEKVAPARGELKKQLERAQPDDLADIAIFGRMVANDHTLMVEGAGLFSHAISTHEVANDVDFFSAVDELKPEESEGAGHIGTLEFNTACYYRYVGVNWDLLSDPNHLKVLSPSDRKAVLDTFLRAAILAVPNARKNSMFGHNPPGVVLGVVRSGQPLSLANAFERPIRSRNGYLEPSRKALEEHYVTLDTVFSLKTQQTVWLLTHRNQQDGQPSNRHDLSPKVDAVADNLDQFISRLLETLPNE